MDSAVWRDDNANAVSGLDTLDIFGNLDAVNEESYSIASLHFGKPAMIIPSVLTIAGAYPNPFNSTTAITIQLPETERTQVSIIDLNGRLVENLLDRELNAGAHHLIWNAERLSSGQYFIQARTGEKTAIKEVSLIK